MEENKEVKKEVIQESSKEKEAKIGGDNFLGISILVAAIIIAASLVYVFGPKGKDEPREVKNTAQQQQQFVAPQIGNSVILGDQSAPVTIIEFADYQCPFCGKWYKDVETKIVEKYVKTGKVKIAYKNLAFLGEESVKAAEAALCAKDQNKFWAYHDAIFDAENIDGKENNGNLNATLFMSLATKLGLDTKSFKTCLDSEKYLGIINSDSAEATSADVNATPTVFVNEVRVSNPFTGLDSAIEAALKTK